jgi:hypothetical protein
MQVTGASGVLKRVAATAGLLLILVAAPAGADPLAAAAATAAATQPSLTDMSATEVDSSVCALVDASKDSASTVEKLVGQADDAGAFLGQLVAQYLDSFN